MPGLVDSRPATFHFVNLSASAEQRRSLPPRIAGSKRRYGQAPSPGILGVVRGYPTDAPPRTAITFNEQGPEPSLGWGAPTACSRQRSPRASRTPCHRPSVGRQWRRVEKAFGDLVTIVVDDYDQALNVLRRGANFELVEDPPA